ncbi:MAG: hypothetical protein KAJ60_11100 [Desulfobulbaceae bacterium]|nr:hypothetical protein [Desulfobulbaceae bacterium]MCK5341616.1 hypothetical protein [Desulfobulbaceae bacterium]MCK5403642.1 hypothetical protein [Desulfobulbaceae bacterium]
MQKWLIEENPTWLCKECTKEYSGIFLTLECTWLEKDDSRTITCDDCGCTEGLAGRFGRSRRFIRRVTSLKSGVFEVVTGLLIRPFCRSQASRRRAL